MDPKIYASKRNQIKRTYDPFVLNVQKMQIAGDKKQKSGYWALGTESNYSLARGRLLM